jgi:hypothetical protein
MLTTTAVPFLETGPAENIPLLDRNISPCGSVWLHSFTRYRLLWPLIYLAVQFFRNCLFFRLSLDVNCDIIKLRSFFSNSSIKFLAVLSPYFVRLADSKGPSRVVCFCLPSREDGNRSSFRYVVFSSYLEFRTMGKVHKPSDSECCAPKSEPYRFFKG